MDDSRQVTVDTFSRSAPRTWSMREALLGKVSRTLHAAYSRTGPRGAMPADAQASATASGLRSNCVNYAQEVRSSVSTIGTLSSAYR